MQLRNHQAIIDLLGIGDRIAFVREPALDGWEQDNGVSLPPSYREWCELNVGQRLLELCSNNDWFFLCDPKVARDEDVGLCAEFMSENQNNFDLAIVLDGTPDPGVVFSGVGGKPLPYAASFSDFVFAQIFDWQFQIEEAEPTLIEAAGFAGRFHPMLSRQRTFEVRNTPDILSHVGTVPHRGPSTTYYVDHEQYTEHRFWLSPDARLGVIINESLGTALIHVLGTKAIHPWYASLKEWFADRITKIVWEPATKDE